MKKIVYFTIIAVLLCTSCGNKESSSANIINTADIDEFRKIELVSYRMEDRNSTYQVREEVEKKDYIDISDFLSELSEKKQKNVEVKEEGNSMYYPSVCIYLEDYSMAEIVWDYPNNTFRFAGKEYYINKQSELDELYRLFEKVIGDHVNDLLQ